MLNGTCMKLRPEEDRSSIHGSSRTPVFADTTAESSQLLAGIHVILRMPLLVSRVSEGEHLSTLRA